MKKTVCFILLLPLWLASSSFSRTESLHPSEPNKLALIIAIGAYNTMETGWAQISSQNDVDIIKGSLEKIGFKDIGVLSDANADKKGILAALKALEAKAKPGDMVVIHLSSHGQQIADDNNDEVDGYDEAVVAFGAPVSNAKYRASQRSRGTDLQYDGSLHLRDEEFGDAIASIRAKVYSNVPEKNGQVLVIMDSCHSGTGTRGESAKKRGGEEPLVPDGWVAKGGSKPDEDGGFGIMSENIKSRGDGSSLGKFVLVSGASAEEVNYETEDDAGKGFGSLSYCFSKAIVELQKGSSYRQLFSKIQSEMAERAPKQAPQIEGDVDQEVFGGSFTAQEKYFTITQLVDDRHMKISGGKLMGIEVGTPIAVEKNGTSKASKDGKSLAIGKVSKAGSLEATVELESSLALKNKIDGWVFVTGQSIPDIKVKVSLAGVTDQQLKTSLEKSIKEIGMAEISSDKPDLTVQQAATRGSSFNLDIIDAAYNSKLIETAVSGQDADKVVEGVTNTIQNYAQGKMFKALDLKDDEYRVEITRIIPVKAGSKDIADTLDMKSIMNKGNAIEIVEKSYVFLELTNRSEKIAYFNVIDLQPDGKINPLLPKVKDGAVQPPIQELVLKPLSKKVIKYPIYITKPFGNEIFKVVATGVPFDLASAINTKGANVGTRGSFNPIEKLMGKSFNKGYSRGAEPEFEGGDMGTNTSEFTFKIVEKKP